MPNNNPTRKSWSGPGLTLNHTQRVVRQVVIIMDLSKLAMWVYVLFLDNKPVMVEIKKSNSSHGERLLLDVFRQSGNGLWAVQRFLCYKEIRKEAQKLLSYLLSLLKRDFWTALNMVLQSTAPLGLFDGFGFSLGLVKMSMVVMATRITTASTFYLNLLK